MWEGNAFGQGPKWVKSEHLENLSSAPPAPAQFRRTRNEYSDAGRMGTDISSTERRQRWGVMQKPEIAPEQGLGSCQQLPKPSLLGSKRSHSSGNRSDDSESGTEQSHHDQRQRRRGGFSPEPLGNV